jgi:antitoxin VapB
MAVTIDNPEVEQLARELAKQTGESVDEAVAAAIRERMERKEAAAKPANRIVRDLVVEEIVERMRHEPLPDPVTTHAAIREIQKYLATLPVLDSRSPDDVLGYGEDGLPH